MTSEQKAKEVLKLRKEIEDIKRFALALEVDACRPEVKPKSLMRRKVSFLGIFTINSVDIPIPDKLNCEIGAKCIIWVEELQRRIKDIIPPT